MHSLTELINKGLLVNTFGGAIIIIFSFSSILLLYAVLRYLNLDSRIEMIAVRLGLDLAIHNQAAYHTDENEIKRIVSIEPKSKTFTDYTLAK